MVNPVFAAIMLAGLALPMFPTKTESAERRLYWTGSLVATVSAFFVLYPPELGAGLVLACALGFGLVFRAYMSRPYIKIRGRTYAFALHDSNAEATDGNSDYDPAPDSYAGIATASKMWWLFAAITAACTFLGTIYVIEGEGPWYAIGAAALVALVAALAGHQDSSWGYPVARGQRIPFVIAGIATLGAFTALYLLAYGGGRRWPLRPKRSMEYRRHPHLRKNYP